MPKSTGLTDQHKSQELKKKLLACLEEEHTQFAKEAQAFFDKSQRSEADKTALLKSIIEAVDHVLAAGDWDSSLFLRNVVKPLKGIKEEAQAELNRRQVEAGEQKVVIQPLAEGEKEVYVSLFQSDGLNMAKWAIQLRSLDRYVIGRPVYENEADVEKRIRLRGAGKANEAYVIVVVNKNDIKSDPYQPPLKDQFDHTLLQLTETALSRGRIVGFVHQGVRYHFIDGNLIKG